MAKFKPRIVKNTHGPTVVYDGPQPWSEIMGHDPAAEMARRLDEGEEQSND